jgi:hypothetical protein
MIAEVNVFGVYISSGLFAAILAALIHLGLRRVLQTVGFYRFVAHQNLFDVALFMIIWGVIALTMSTFATALSKLLG